MSRKFGRWILGVIAVIVLVGAVTPADAQIIINTGHRRHYRHHHPYRRYR
jgi:hypothetical protein